MFALRCLFLVYCSIILEDCILRICGRLQADARAHNPMQDPIDQHESRVFPRKRMAQAVNHHVQLALRVGSGGFLLGAGFVRMRAH